MKIQCKLGPAQPVVGGHTYDFKPDEHGRYVTDVANIVHQMVMLSVEHYIVAPNIAVGPVPAPAEATPAPTAVELPVVTEPSVVPAPLVVEPPIATVPPVAEATPSARGRRGKRRG